MISALQKKFVLADAQLCVLLTASSVREELPGHDEDDVLAACLDHSIPTAFDIGLGGRRELRVLPSALAWFKKSLGYRTRRVPWPEVWSELTRGLNTEKPWLDGEIVRCLLNCGGDHLIRLVDEGWLAMMPGTTYRRGPGGAPQIKLKSLETYLKNNLL
jgi:hypothetical protein